MQATPVASATAAQAAAAGQYTSKFIAIVVVPRILNTVDILAPRPEIPAVVVADPGMLAQ
jgi:hypothetical protein